MKFKDGFKIILVVLLIAVMLLSAILPAFAAEIDDLPHIVKWVNGGAQVADGSYLNDTWAVDDTGVSKNKYVLINQDGLEEMRVAKYPDDISSGNTAALTKAKGTFSLAVPENIVGEVAISFESDAAVYDVYFNESNTYTASADFLPGTYKVKSVEVSSDLNGQYKLQDDVVVDVKDKAFSVNLKVEKLAQEETTKEVEDNNNDGVLSTFKGFDSNGDLLKDTIKMLVAVAVLFIIYSLIKRKREKALEAKK